MRLDSAGHADLWVGADGARLELARDEAGNLSRIASGDWSLAIEGPADGRTLRARDPAGATDLLLEAGGRIRTLARGADRVSIELDALQRVRRVTLPGSRNALEYCWDEDQGCVVRAEGGGPLLRLGAAGGARRIALDGSTWWEEELTPKRVRLRAAMAGRLCETLELRLEAMAAIAERRWSDGSGDRFERDGRGRLASWTTTAVDGTETERRWAYRGDQLAEDEAGRRTLDAGGRVLRLDRPNGASVRYRYDPAGRRVARDEADRTAIYRYDPLGSLIAVERGGVDAAFDFDGFGRRVTARTGGGPTRHEHRDEAGRLWAVTDEAGRALHCYIWLGDRIAARIDGAIGEPLAEAYLCDPLGTPNGVFIAEPEGWRFERLDAPPYGRADDALRPTLYGHFGDPETGLIHMGARELDPELGLFLSPDPWHGGEDDPRRLAGTPEAALQRERELPIDGFHAYALCRFDPLGRCDRDGHVSAGDVFLHILRWILLPTWGFPLTSISLFFFQPFNLYMEVIGLIVWGFKQLCEDKSHPWGNHTIAKATWLLGSVRQFTFAFGLNGFLPRVVSGGGLGSDRAVTVGNVVWISSHELDFLGRPEVVDVEDIGGGPAGIKLNDDPTKESVVALLAADASAKQKLHVSHWTRGLGNVVAARGGAEGFADAPAGGAAGAAAVGAIHLRQPVPMAVAVPREADSDERLELHEFVRPTAPGAAPEARLETVVDVWFALKVPKDTGYVAGDWLRISAPDAPAPSPDAAFRRIRETLPAADHVALILSEPLPPRFQGAGLSSGLKLEAASVIAGATASADWAAGAPATTLERVIAAAPPPADFPPDLSSDSMVRIVATTPAAPPPIPGLPAGPPEDTRFTQIKAIRARLTLAPDAAGAAAGAVVQRLARAGPTFRGTVAKIAERSKIKLTAPHPDVAENDLLVVTRGAAPPAYVRATGSPAAGVITVDPALTAALATADGTQVELQRTEAGGDDGAAAVAAVAGADVDVTVPRAGFLAAGNLVRIDVAGVPALRRVEAVSRMEIDIADEPVGTGSLTLTPAATASDRIRTGVELAPPGRFLKWTGGSPLGALGNWPDTVLGIRRAGIRPETCAFYVKWAGARPAGFDPDFHHVWTIATHGADQYIVLETPLPIVRRKNQGGEMKTWWRLDPDDEAGDADLLIDPVPSPMDLIAMEYATSGAQRSDRAGGARLLAHEPEVLVPDDPRVHDTHRRALIEHEIHHTVQCNFWGPFMGALPLQGLVMTAVDFAAAAGADIPDWLHQVERDAEGNPPQDADGRIPNNTELNPFQVVSMGGLMQLAWKYVFLSPFRPIGDLNDRIEALDFEDFNNVFNPVSRLITQNLPQVDPDAPADERWLHLFGQMLSKALDLRSWTPFLGFVPTLLPDGPTNFIEQGASRASGDLYSTILTANDRFNLKAKGRLFGSSVDLSANIHSGLGRPVRLLMFCGFRLDRVLSSSNADVPDATIAYRQWFAEVDPFLITIPAGRPKALFPAALYAVRPAGGGAPAPVMIGGPPPARTPAQFVEASPGDTVVPKLRALVPLPPHVNRSLGFYLVAAAPGALDIASPTHDPEAGTETVTITVADEVLLGEEAIPWTMPTADGAAAPAPTLKRFQTEEAEFKVREPRDPTSSAFGDAGIGDFVLDLSDPAVTSAPLAGNDGWKLVMPAGVPAGPVRIRLFRIVKKDDAAFDLAFPDVPSLAGRRSYLDADVFVVVRDVSLTVDPLPEIPAATQAWDQPFELALPIRLAGGERSIVVTPPAGVAAPPVARIGDDGRGEKWSIGPLAEPPPEDAKFQVTVTYGRPGASVDKIFELTLRPGIEVTAATDDLLPGTPLELTLAGGTPPYTVAVEPEIAGVEVSQPAPDKVRLTARAAPDAEMEIAVKATDSADPVGQGLRRIKLKTMPPILMPNESADYFDYVLPATFGLARPLINGRSSGGAGANVDLTEPLDAMETAVKATAAGDSIYLSAWFFEPATPLTAGGIGGAATWGELFKKKAQDGVKIRILINDFDPISGLDRWLNADGLAPLDATIASLPAAKRDNLKYVVSLHPAHFGSLKAALAGQGFRNIHIASHHQKFMVVRRGAELIGFCGGLDIESRKTPATWRDAGLVGWHDIQVQLEGPVTRDLEREFIARWNRERGNSARPARPGWSAFEELSPTPLSAAEDVPARKPHVIQMLRTIADDSAISPFATKRDDIKQVYRRAIAGARQFLYLENQYFRSTELADWIVEAGRDQPALKVILVVVASAAADDGANALTEHGDYLQFETFDRIARGLGPRAGFYTMTNRAVHSKFMLVDDSWMTIGSANANVRSFELDSELNVQIGDPALARAFRTRLWAHNLGVPEATVAGWAVGDFLGQWNAVAAANAGRAIPGMEGEGVVAFDHRAAPGDRHGSLPDALVELDFGTDGALREGGGPEPDRIG